MVHFTASAEANRSSDFVDLSESSDDDEEGGGESGEEASSSSGADVESCGKTNNLHTLRSTPKHTNIINMPTFWFKHWLLI